MKAINQKSQRSRGWGAVCTGRAWPCGRGAGQCGSSRAGGLCPLGTPEPLGVSLGGAWLGRQAGTWVGSPSHCLWLT